MGLYFLNTFKIFSSAESILLMNLLILSKLSGMRPVVI